MKTNLLSFGLIFCVILMFVNQASTQHTFSIVAIDPVTQEVGSAGASFVPDAPVSTINKVFTVHPGLGAIHTQAHYNEDNQAFASQLMLQHFSPQDIIDYMVAWDVEGDPSQRQYIIIDLVDGGRTAAYTGEACPDYANHILGKNYAVAGNILYGRNVLDSMQAGFLNTSGSLADKLMAALQGGKNVGGDKRGELYGLSSLLASLKVAKPYDSQDSLYLDIVISYGSSSDYSSLPDPVDSLQTLYNQWKGQPIRASIPNMDVFSGNVIQVPVHISFPDNFSCGSASLAVCGYKNKLEFKQVLTDSSLSGETNWIWQTDESDSLFLTAKASGDSISGEGVLVRLEFFIPDTASGFVPLQLSFASFHEKAKPFVELLSGGINIQRKIDYGDVALDGKVDAGDVSLILQYLVGKTELENQQKLNANVSLDSTLSALDASIILQYVAGTLNSLPCDSTISLIANGDLEMSNADFNPGDIVKVPIHLSNGKNILSFECELSYDSSFLDYSGIRWADQLEAFQIEEQSKNGRLIFARAGLSPVEQDNIFATLEFGTKNITADETKVSLDRLRWNEEKSRTNVTFAILSKITNVKAKILPKEFSLHPVFPNPFNSSTAISYALPKQSTVSIQVYNIRGELIAALVDQKQMAGEHSLNWNASHLSSGTYFIRMKAGNFRQINKCLLLR